MSDVGGMSSAQRLTVRGLGYNLLRWGEGTPRIFVLHGWLDVAATFAPLAASWSRLAPVAAPDWRGFGDSDYAPGGYWFADYLADLESILDQLTADAPVVLIGHSMGAQVASLYAGLRPDRVSHLVCLDGLFLPDMPPSIAPKRMRRWLDELKTSPKDHRYDSFEALAERVRVQHPRLDAERALDIAHCWGRRQPDGRIGLCADPAHRRILPTLFRVSESMAVWREIKAPTLFVDGGASPFAKAIGPEEIASRRACFVRHEVLTLPDAGHMLHFDAPEQTAEVVSDWLRAGGVGAQVSDS
jgi:pimeloyl-ACP methyl ester carboxylesterase